MSESMITSIYVEGILRPKKNQSQIIVRFQWIDSSAVDQGFIIRQCRRELSKRWALLYSLSDLGLYLFCLIVFSFTLVTQMATL